MNPDTNHSLNEDVPEEVLNALLLFRNFIKLSVGYTEMNIILKQVQCEILAHFANFSHEQLINLSEDIPEEVLNALLLFRNFIKLSVGYTEMNTILKQVQCEVLAHFVNFSHDQLIKLMSHRCMRIFFEGEYHSKDPSENSSNIKVGIALIFELSLNKLLPILTKQ